MIILKNTEKKVITVIGGGTGQSTILRGIKTLGHEVNAIVTMADDGGSSGMLRNDLGMLPPGDVRNCIIALADMEPEMETLMQFRFSEGSLKGQNFGNLLLAALNNIYGDFELAVSKISNILAVKGNILPVTLDDVKLKAKLKDGRDILGESVIPEVCKSSGTSIERISIIPEDAKPYKEAINAIDRADVLLIGPGSLYTSILPNLVIEGVSKHVKESSAKKVFICNIMSENGETNGYTVLEFIDALYAHKNIGQLDYIVVNTGIPPEYILEKYRTKEQEIIKFDEEQKKRIEKFGIKIMEEDVVSIKNGLIFHDSEKISKIVNYILNNK